MSAQRTVCIDAVDFRNRVAFLETGEMVPFSSLIGRDGEETEDSGDAIGAIAALPGGGWVVIDFADYERRSLN